MFSQSFESMISIINIPPWYVFLMGSKDRRPLPKEKAQDKGIWNLGLGIRDLPNVHRNS